MPSQTRITTKAQEVYKADFDRFDVNKNGALEDDELQEMARFQLGGAADDEEKVKAFVAQMDKNGDDKIELAEYMDKILGVGWVVADADPEGEPYVCGKTTCTMAEMVDTANKVYIEMKKIPLICATKEEKAEAITTFWTYGSGCTPLDCKSLVGLAMNQGKPAAWDRIQTAAEGAMKVGTGNTLVLQMRNGAADLCGIAKDTGTEQAATIAGLFTATLEKSEAAFPAFALEAGDCKPEFKVR